MAVAIGAELNELCRQWRDARGRPGQDAANVRDAAVNDARTLAQGADTQAEAEAWFATTLEGSDGEARFFAAAVLDGFMPKRILGPMITAAVHEPNPSFNKSFVRPAVRCAGPERVADALVRIFREGVAEDRVGALAALYWLPPVAHDCGFDLDGTQGIRARRACGRVLGDRLSRTAASDSPVAEVSSDSVRQACRESGTSGGDLPCRYRRLPSITHRGAARERHAAGAVASPGVLSRCGSHPAG